MFSTRKKPFYVTYIIQLFYTDTQLHNVKKVLGKCYLVTYG